MSQKSITSFFTKTPAKKPADEDGENLNRNNKRKLSSSEEEVKSKTTPTNKIKEKKSAKRIRPSKSPAVKSKTDSTKLIKTVKNSSPASPSKSDTENKDANKIKPVGKAKWNKIIDTDSSSEDEIKPPKKESKLEEISEPPVETKKEESENNTSTSDNNDSIKSKKESPKTKKISPSNKKKTKTENVSPKEKKSSKSKKEDSNKKSESPTKPMHSFFGPKKTELSDEAETNQTTSDKKQISLKKAGEGDKGAFYDPSVVAAKYNPVEHASWKEGEKVPYLALAKTLESIEATSGRLKMIETLGNFLRSVIVLTPVDLLPCIYLCLNQLAPAYEGLELGIAETTLMKAIAQSTGRTLKDIKSDCQKLGDLAIVAEQSRSNQRMMFTPAPLTVRGVFDKLREVAQMSGSTSMGKKVDKIQSLFVACRYSEARYLTRSLAGSNLRVGLAEQSVLQAIAQACTFTPPDQERPCTILNALKKMSADSVKSKVDEQASILKTAYCECPCYDRIVPVLLEDGIKGLPDKCRLEPGTPLKPMLAHPTTGISEVLTRFDGIKFTCEWKYDGERAQIHIKKDSTVNIYSRNQENNTTKYPDILNRISGTTNEDVESAILDCEAVAWDKENNAILPFQILSTRKRKDANEADIKVQVCVFMFDLLYLNGEPLVREPFSKRRELLHKHFKEVPGEWQYATALDTNKLEELQIFLEDAIKGNCEGLMVKTLHEEATYEIAKRSRNWLKLKKDYLAGCGDTLDVVVIGGYFGRGKRTGVYGGFLLACYDAENEEYQSICKIGTGFSDADLQQHSEFLKSHIIPSPKSYYRYDTQHEPDHWFDVSQVWEIKCADLSLSPAHRAAMGIVDPEKGISLRFPRFIRIRDDKNVDDATTAQQVADMYNSQDQIKNSTAKKATDEDFF